LLREFDDDDAADEHDVLRTSVVEESVSEFNARGEPLFEDDTAS